MPQGYVKDWAIAACAANLKERLGKMVFFVTDDSSQRTIGFTHFGLAVADRTFLERAAAQPAGGLLAHEGLVNIPLSQGARLKAVRKAVEEERRKQQQRPQAAAGGAAEKRPRGGAEQKGGGEAGQPSKRARGGSR